MTERGGLDMTRTARMNARSTIDSAPAFSVRPKWLLAVGLIVTALLGATSVFSPLPLVAAVGLAGFLALSTKTGIDTASLTAAILIFSMTGFASRLGSLGNLLTTGAAVLVVAVFAARIQNIKVDASARIGFGIFITVGLIFLVINFTRNAEYAVLGWISLVMPVIAFCAAVGTLARIYEDPARYQRSKNVLLSAMLFGVLVNIALGMRQAFFGLTGVEVATVVSNGSTYLVGQQERSIGAFESSQTYGLFMALVAPFLLFYAFEYRGWRRSTLFALGVLATAAVYLSLLRGAVFGVFAAIVIGLIIPSGARKSAKVWIALTFSTVAFAAFFLVESSSGNERWSAAKDRVLSIFDLSNDTSFNARSSETLPIAIAAFRENIWGLGGGAAGPISERFPSVAPLGTIVTDNGYLNLGIQLGLIGFFGLAVCFVYLIRTLWRGSSNLSRGSLLILVALLTAMFFSGYWNLTGPMVIGATLVAVGFVERSRCDRLSESESCDLSN